MAVLQNTDVAVIGAGPAGSCAAALLADAGWRVTVLERAHFPRFAIGESLLPQCMDSLEHAHMLEPLQRAGFQTKRGVLFGKGRASGRFRFADASHVNWPYTWHVQRATFDDLLAKEAARRGADVRFGQTVKHVDRQVAGAPRLKVTDDADAQTELRARFVCDASGNGRVLPRLLNLEQPARASTRSALFTHITDNITATDFERSEILLTIHPTRPDVWYWLICFSDGRASVGVVGERDYIATQADDPESQLHALINQEPRLARYLVNAEYTDRVRGAGQFATPISQLHGRDFALLGNAGEFVDPLFSSGVTIALQSAINAVPLIDRQLKNQTVDWESDYERPLRRGLAVFRAFVDAWYEGGLRHVFFADDPPADVRGWIGAVLAGYVWNQTNPYVAQPTRRLRTLCRACAP